MNALARSARFFKSHKFQRCSRFIFLQTISSTSSDSEMGFDSEDSEIYYITEVETEENDESRLSISQTSSDND